MKEPKKRKHPLGYYFLHDFAKVTAGIPGLIAFRPKIYFENEAARARIRGGALLIGNHAGFFDPIYMMFAIWYRRHHFICTKELFEGKQKFFFEHFRCIPIDRGNFGIDSFRLIVEHLSQGKIVSMFPEGRIEDGMKSFKSGMVLMAMKSKTPIIPIYIQPRSHWWQRLRMAVGEGVDVCTLCGSGANFSRVEDIAALLHDKEIQLQKLCERD